MWPSCLLHQHYLGCWYQPNIPNQNLSVRSDITKMMEEEALDPLSLMETPTSKKWTKLPLWELQKPVEKLQYPTYTKSGLAAPEWVRKFTAFTCYSPSPSQESGITTGKLSTHDCSLRSEREEWNMHVTFWYSEELPNKGLFSVLSDLEHGWKPA